MLCVVVVNGVGEVCGGPKNLFFFFIIIIFFIGLRRYNALQPLKTWDCNYELKTGLLLMLCVLNHMGFCCCQVL